MPEAFRYDYFCGYSGPQHYRVGHQSPRLVNRQVKVAFFLLQKSLLEQVLNGLQRLQTMPESWPACLFISICLAFLLETIEVASRDFHFFSKKIDEDEPGRESDIEDYCLGVDGVVFGWIYKLLSIKTRSTSTRGSLRTTQLTEAILKLRQQFGKISHFLLVISPSNTCHDRFRRIPKHATGLANPRHVSTRRRTS